MADVVQSSVAAAAHNAAHAHAHGHSPYLAHHFDTPVQQFDSGKLGMWLFLATEVLLFGGLFCAYAVYRANHPEIFLFAHKYLDVFWGGVNTVILLASSFTMAYAVHCSQTNRRIGLIAGLALTLAGGAGFMIIKYVEYRHKFHVGLLPGENYTFDPVKYATEHGDDHGATGATGTQKEAPHAAGDKSAAATGAAQVTADAPAVGGGMTPAGSTDASAAAAGAALAVAVTPPGEPERSIIQPKSRGPVGLAQPVDPHHAAPASADAKNVHIFFGIYFLMTGLHGIHVLAGMAVIAYLLVKSLQGAYSSEYFTPVDLGGLYWHLVDLIWIYLFPLLYLIH